MVLVPFALAMLFSFLLTPAVIWLERIRLPRVLAVLFVMAFSVAAIGSVGWMVTDQLIDVTNQLPSYRANIKKKMESLRSPKGQSLNKATDAMMELGKELAAAPMSGPTGRKSGASESLSPARPLPVEVVAPPMNLLESAGNVLGPLGTAESWSFSRFSCWCGERICAIASSAWPGGGV
jgi:energy-coupling factor transporter transmembrane protein EcfT